MSRIAVICFAISVVASAGCSDDDLACAEVDPSCAPLYEPTFDNVYNNTLAPTCAPAGGACHSIEGNAAGIAYDDIDTAYQVLVGDGTGGSVIPGDASCSSVSKRINAGRAADLMPPGEPLPAAERCAIERWIANGAQR